MPGPIVLLDARQVGSRAHVINWRRLRGWTQARSAEWWGCSERTWRRWETGESRVPGPLLKRLSPPLPRS